MAERAAARLDDVRRGNLSRVLTHAHRAEAPPSRSDLVAATGLNRSTVAALVGELAALGLVREAEAADRRGVGRPSPLLIARPETVALAVNPERDAVTVGVVRLGGEVVLRERYELERAPSVGEAVDCAAAAVRRARAELPEGTRIAGIGVAVPGLVHARSGLVRLAPHLGWVDAPIADLLAEATGLPAWAANDASLGATAEHLFGAGRGARDLIYLNGGASGIGGGVIAGGAPLGGLGGYAGEFGHNVVTAPQPGTGPLGRTLEEEVNRDALLALLGLRSADETALEAALLAAAASPGPLREEVARQLDVLALAVRNAVNVLNPELVLLGGFLASLDAALPGRLPAAAIAHALPPAAEGLRIARARLGANLLLIGAAELAFAPLLADPAGAPLAPAAR